jgi:putative transposase
VAETNVFELTQPGTFSDPLTEVLRNGARTLLEQAVEAEVVAWLSTHTDKLTDDGRRRLVRHGHMPEREVMTGIGAVAVRCPRVRDRVGEGGERIRFSSAILPPSRMPAGSLPRRSLSVCRDHSPLRHCRFFSIRRVGRLLLYNCL